MKNKATGKTVKKENLPEKVCVSCGRPFAWRKKWERCWDEVTTCSKSCNAQRKRDGGGSSDEEKEGGGPVEVRGGAQKVRSQGMEMAAASQDRKAARRAKREGTADPAEFSKPCGACAAPSDLLIRCQTDSTGKWSMLCGKCWKTASGGVTDGDADHPHYRYGGLWKNRYAAKSA